MDNLKVIENDLVPVYVTNKGEKVVNGRELHSVLQSKQDFSTWVKKRLSECDAKENKDFVRFHEKVEGNNATMIEYIILLDTGKEMAMLERNAKGKQVRRYFIKVDEMYKEEKTMPTTIPEQIQLLAQGNVMANKRIDRAEMRIRDLEDTMTLDYGQQAVLGQTVNKTVLNHLGGKESPAYKPIGRKVFAECNSDLKHYFKVNARANVPKKRYEEAVAYAENWKPCTNTVMLINEYNSQNKLDI